jgi:hypothetical protein
VELKVFRVCKPCLGRPLQILVSICFVSNAEKRTHADTLDYNKNGQLTPSK